MRAGLEMDRGWQSYRSRGELAAFRDAYIGLLIEGDHPPRKWNLVSRRVTKI
jgi:hypothetical protein